LCTIAAVEIKTDGETLEDGEVNEDVAPKGFYCWLASLHLGSTSSNTKLSAS